MIKLNSKTVDLKPKVNNKNQKLLQFNNNKVCKLQRVLYLLMIHVSPFLTFKNSKRMKIIIIKLKKKISKMLILI